MVRGLEYWRVKHRGRERCVKNWQPSRKLLPTELIGLHGRPPINGALSLEKFSLSSAMLSEKLSLS